MDATALILAAGGRGLRFGGACLKTLVALEGEPVVRRALRAFAGRVAHTVLVVPAGCEAAFAAAVGDVSGALEIVAGGARRQDSVAAGLRALPTGAAWVLVHDAARPLVAPETVAAVLAAARAHGAAIPVVPVDSTLKAVAPDGRVRHTVAREELCLVQTPQGFRRDLLEAALARAGGADRTFTDESALLEDAGFAVMTVPGDPFNRKITTSADLAWAASWLRAGGLRAAATGAV
ncbi:MAG: 2-C-methyl-D-erythritol 4-phosphate cytidylyltransferase [Planctomycetes bacterium]|nr:2-C-methyl-D-erythritol 4-phosphate cytidylyltransferase [Planctomycetota bacterium]